MNDATTAPAATRTRPPASVVGPWAWLRANLPVAVADEAPTATAPTEAPSVKTSTLLWSSDVIASEPIGASGMRSLILSTL